MRKMTSQFDDLLTVPKAKHSREIQPNGRPRWGWTEASVWTERMLGTLERGIKGGKWYSLIDKVWMMENLDSAARKVAQGKSRKKADGRRCRHYAQTRHRRLPSLQEKLKAGQYYPPPAERVWIPKAGSKEMRPLGISPVESRVVQMAVRNVIEPIFENIFAQHSYGFRPERGAKEALRLIVEALAQGKIWVVDADIKGYFDNIPQEPLMELVAQHISDGALLELINRFLKQGVMESGKGWQPTETGTPQGAVISPLLANIYLNPLDHVMAQQNRLIIRYADDFVILCESQKEAEEALEQVRQWMNQAGLTLHPTKTRIVNAAEPGGFDFLGYHFERGYRWPRQKSIEKLKDAVVSKTPRKRSGPLTHIIEDLNRTLRGWFAYFKHSHWTTFERLDGWIRQRLRSILRKWNKRSGRATGKDNQRWPNAYFVERGLISLALAHAKAANLYQ